MFRTNESASFYASICSDLKKRGVSDIFIACHDNLKGLGEAIGRRVLAMTLDDASGLLEKIAAF